MSKCTGKNCPIIGKRIDCDLPLCPWRTSPDTVYVDLDYEEIVLWFDKDGNVTLLGKGNGKVNERARNNRP